jgi:hypothetical protein
MTALVRPGTRTLCSRCKQIVEQQSDGDWSAIQWLIDDPCAGLPHVPRLLRDARTDYPVNPGSRCSISCGYCGRCD